MSTVLPVVAGVDGSPTSLDAAVWAANAAKRRGLPLLLVSVTPVSPGVLSVLVPLPQEFYDDQRQLTTNVLHEALTRVRAEVGDDALVIETKAVTGMPAAELLACSKQAAMIVTGTRGLGDLTAGFAGSVSSALIGHAGCPVVVIHGGKPQSNVSAGPVVVGVDGTDNSVPAVAAAFEEASLRSVDLIAVHAFSDVLLASWFEDDWVSIEEAERAVLSEQLAGYADRYPDVKVRSVVSKDRPVNSLLEHADNASLIVVGSRGRGGYMGMLLGSTSRAVVHTAEVPVMIIRG